MILNKSVYTAYYTNTFTGKSQHGTSIVIGGIKNLSKGYVLYECQDLKIACNINQRQCARFICIFFERCLHNIDSLCRIKLNLRVFCYGNPKNEYELWIRLRHVANSIDCFSMSIISNCDTSPIFFQYFFDKFLGINMQV